MKQALNLATANLNFGRSARAHRSDANEISKGADVVCLQETVAGYGGSQWKAAQWKRGPRRNGGEAVLVRNDRSVPYGKRGRSSLFGSERIRVRIGRRVLPFYDVWLTDFGWIRVFSLHAEPKRMRKLMHWRVRRSLLAALNASPHPWVVGGDWNWLLGNDPFGLTKRFGAKFYGQRIDGFAVSRELQAFVRNVSARQDPQRKENHPWVFLTLSKGN